MAIDQVIVLMRSALKTSVTNEIVIIAIVPMKMPCQASLPISHQKRGQRTAMRRRKYRIDSKHPRDMAAAMCIELGVPDERIERVEGINTSEEMRHLSEYLKRSGRVGLITSAFHMPRAMRLARSQGLELIPLPADFLTPADLFPTVLDFIPDAEAIMVTRLACKEYLAKLVGR